MVSETYDALTAAGVPEDKAREAAEVFTKDDNCFDKLEKILDLRFAFIETRFVKIEGEMALLKGMLGFNSATTVALLFLALRH